MHAHQVFPFYNELTLTKSFTITIKKCVPNFQYFYKMVNNNEKKCVENCDDKYSYNGRCYDNCPAGLYVSGNQYFPKCDTNKYFEKDESNLICISECPHISDGNNYTYLTSYGKCIKECPDGENFISTNNINCLTNCGNDFFKNWNELQEEITTFINALQIVEMMSMLMEQKNAKQVVMIIHIYMNQKRYVILLAFPQISNFLQ